MKIVVADPRALLLCGNSRELLSVLPENSIDAVVSDPPYELGFMNRGWDRSGIAFCPDFWSVVLRVLKPGGHLLSCGGSRTYHRMTCAVEDAGFEIRDALQWLYGSGFPKSMDVAKAIDKSLGHERAVVGAGASSCPDLAAGRECSCYLTRTENSQSGATKHTADTAPASLAALQWEGWETALKPAHEPIMLARKPLDGTVAQNIARWGVGAINVGACRVGGGRYPSNLLLDEAAAAQLDSQVAPSKSRKGKPRASAQPGDGWGMTATGAEYEDSGGPSRFFYVAKPSKREKEAGCEHLPQKSAGEATDRQDGSAGLNSPRAGAGRTSGAKNFHPTVKPVDLMKYLCRLVTPPGGTVLDPFAGSGTTAVAAIAEGFGFVGVELGEEHAAIAAARIQHALKETT